MVRKRKKNREPYQTELDPRYGKNWAKISIDCRKEVKVCCFCLVKKATQTHHVQYVLDFTAEQPVLLLDDVKLGEHVFPVCNNCHLSIHSHQNWLVVKDHPELNHNTEKIIRNLKIGYELSTRIKNS